MFWLHWLGFLVRWCCMWCRHTGVWGGFASRNQVAKCSACESDFLLSMMSLLTSAKCWSVALDFTKVLHHFLFELLLDVPHVGFSSVFSIWLCGSPLNFYTCCCGHSRRSLQFCSCMVLRGLKSWDIDPTVSFLTDLLGRSLWGWRICGKAMHSQPLQIELVSDVSVDWMDKFGPDLGASGAETECSPLLELSLACSSDLASLLCCSCSVSEGIFSVMRHVS